MTIWKTIPSRNHFSVSSAGKVRRIAKDGRASQVGKILKPYLNQRGYFQIDLRDGLRPKKPYVHRLVFNAFLGELREGMTVNHKNCRKTDNRPSNLEQLTNEQNQAHAAARGRHRRGVDQWKAKLSPPKIRLIRQRLARGEGMTSIGRSFGVTIGAIKGIARGHNWKWVK